MPVRVCVMTSVHPASDVRIFHKECKSLAREGYEVVLIASGAQRGLHDGVRLEPLPQWKNRLDRMLRGSAVLYHKARQLNADFYHFHDPELIPVGLLLQASGRKVVYDVHEDLPQSCYSKSYIPHVLRGLASKIADAAERWASRRFSAVIAATPSIAARFHASNANVTVVHNYPRIEELRSAAQIPEARDGFLVYVGMRITLARGLKEMVQAMGLLPAAIPARLKLVGKVEPPSLLESLPRLAGWARTEWLGWVGRTEVAEILRRARIGLVLLHAEPNYVTAEPVKLFEYMCAGVPVIASDFHAYREIVEGTRCGLVVNPLDPQQIARAVAYLWMHPEEAEQMGRRGFEAVKWRYNWANEERALLRAYRQLSIPGPVSDTQTANTEHCA